MIKSAMALLTLACVGQVYSTACAAEDRIVVPAPLQDLRPAKLCAANALNLSRCARAWERLVLTSTAPRGSEDTWNAAEFEGIVYGFYVAHAGPQAAYGKRKWCTGTLESYDQLYRTIAEDLVAHSARLTIDDVIAEYLSKTSERLWPCR